MKKRLYLLFTILSAGAVLTLSSCLKDSRYVDFSKVGTNVNFPLGGLANFSGDAITETPDTDANGTIVRQFAVNVASPNVPTVATTLTLAVDNSIVGTYPTTPVAYDVMPEDAYSFTATSVTIPAGQQYATASITFFKNKLDPSKSYMLPVKIAKTTNGIISANYSIHYFHFIGNDFAGAYEHFYDRWSVPDSTQAAKKDNDHVDLGVYTLSPVSPTEITVQTGYYTAPNFDITFTKTGSGASATYSNFAVKFLAADISSGLWATNITVVTQPKFVSAGFDPSKSYTYAEAIKLFRIYYTTATRAVIDTYVKL